MLVVPPPPQSIISRATGVAVADVFSTDLYTGNGSTQSITNGIDLNGEGGLVWVKGRSPAYGHRWTDTARGATKIIYSSATSAEGTESGVTAFNSNGFSLGSAAGQNENASTFGAWTFRKASGFFDVVTYTGNGSARTISHNLGVEPGMIIVKPTSLVGGWVVYHRSNTGSPATQYLQLNSTGATATYSGFWDDTAPTSSVFSLGSDSSVNGNTHSYVAYLFGHDDIIQCGSYTGNGSTSGPIINLGWDPQWILIKNSDNTSSWSIFDTARGLASGNDARLRADATSADDGTTDWLDLTGTGFEINVTSSQLNTNTQDYIYMAIKAE